MASNRAVAYVGPKKLEIRHLDDPKLVDPRGKPCHHGVILKLVTTNICGSDQHIYRGRFPAPTGMILGHENTGEVVEVGRDVEFIKVGDLVSVPFKVSCGRCRNCREQHHRGLHYHESRSGRSRKHRDHPSRKGCRGVPHFR